MADSLGFFSAAVSSSESESEDEEETPSKSVARERSPSVDKQEVGPSSGKLPSPSTLFATVGRPDFLAKPDPEIDWYDLKTKQEDEPGTFQLNSVPPPSSLKSQPVKYGNKERSTPVRETSTSKNERETESFRQKEKRKRERGQSSRGKNYVEEEKRVLKQSYTAGAGLGFD